VLFLLYLCCVVEEEKRLDLFDFLFFVLKFLFLSFLLLKREREEREEFGSF